MGEAGMQRFKSAQAPFLAVVYLCFKFFFFVLTYECAIFFRSIGPPTEDSTAGHIYMPTRRALHILTHPLLLSASIKGHGGLMPDASAPPWAQTEKDREKRRLKVPFHRDAIQRPLAHPTKLSIPQIIFVPAATASAATKMTIINTVSSSSSNNTTTIIIVLLLP
jgi:hypothetical protein